MSHQIHISKDQTKETRYKELLPQIAALLEGEKDQIANYANLSAALRQSFGFFWVGFYIVKAQQLVLGPFQGTIACTRIAFGKGVCGTAWKEKKAILVPDVDQFPGHIACDSASRSEVVIPIIENNEVVAVLDVDSDQLAHFDETDVLYLEQIVSLLVERK